MPNYVHDDKAGRKSGGWLPLAELAEKYPHSPGFRVAGGTSEESAAKVAPHAGRLRQTILKVFMAEPARGFLPDEIATLINERELVIRPRCSELRRLGLLRFTGQRRKNPVSGFEAAELAITDKGLEAVSQ
jgi:hypothetical protein